MLKTSLILFPDSKNDYSKSIEIAMEYHRIIYGIFRGNSLLSAYFISSGTNLISDDKKTFKILENIPPFDGQESTLEKSIENATKFLERRKFSTFHCGRIVFIFPDLTFLPTLKDGAIQEDQIFGKISQLTHNGEDFDKLFCDVFIHVEDYKSEMVSFERMSIHIINKDNNIIPNILKKQLNLSSISTTNGFNALFINNTSETVDIVVNPMQEGAITYLEKNCVHPLIKFSTNLVFCLSQSNREIIENDFKSKVLIIVTESQSFMISHSRYAGYRLSYVTNNTPEVRDQYFFNFTPAEENISNFYFSLPLLLQIGQAQPGFLFKRGEKSNQLSRILSLASDENVQFLFTAIKDSAIRDIASKILSSVISPNLNINKTNTVKQALIDFDASYKNACAINEQNVKTSLTKIFKGLFAITTAFQSVTQTHATINKTMADYMQQNMY